MALQTPRGVRTSADMVVKAPVTRPKRKAKQPIPDARQRSELRQRAKVRLEQISHEELKHKEIRDKAVEEKKSFIENLNS